MARPPDRPAAYQVGPSRRDHVKTNQPNGSSKDDFTQQAFSDFDVSKHGLDRSQLERFVNSYYGKDAVGPSEMEWVLAIADRDHSGRVSLDEMNRVKASLAAYMKVKKDLRVLFSKYDKNRNGMLDRSELRDLLVELNDDIPVQEDELDWVINSMGKSSQVNLMVFDLEKAINFWYNNVEPPAEPVKPLISRSGSDVHHHVSERHKAHRSAGEDQKFAAGPSRHDNAKQRSSGSDTVSMQRFEDFNDSGVDGLDRKNLRRMINAVSCQDSLDDSEVDWILAIADMDSDGKIGKEEFTIVQKALNNYIEVRKKLRPIFKRYDVDQNKMLDKEELKGMLTELNDGIPVHKSDVDWVLEHSKHHKGGIVQHELEQAINFWYGNVKPPDPVAHSKDRSKGGAVGRAVSGHHHHPRNDQD